MTKEKKVLEKDIKDKDALITYLQTKVTNLEKKRKCKAGSRKHEANTDVIAAIDTYVKGILFRTVKFAQVGRELQSVTKVAWDGIKGKKKLELGANPMTLTHFAEIYDSSILKSLSDRCQYIQTRCQDASKGTFWALLFTFGLEFGKIKDVSDSFFSSLHNFGRRTVKLCPLSKNWRLFGTYQRVQGKKMMMTPRPNTIITWRY